ncbi:TolC family protein [Chitinispirillales bacterium ANBcel5]|uniref:TolC family protein n=1 Tax=Cellulosispirillum alkaliphilum TaxID=3039283 RepID=UPI002A4F404A|nr:TolC family protein [Chitinispirillales bacterium ANBcel5]
MSNLRRTLVALLLLFTMLLTPRVFGESSTGTEPYQSPVGTTLQDYIDYALGNNPAISAAQNNLRAQREQVSIDSYLPDPMVMSRFGSDDGFSSVGVSQKVLFPTKILTQREAARELVKREEAKLQHVRSETVARVTEAYSALYSAKRMLSVLEDNLGLLVFLEENTRVRYITGAAPQSELVRLQVEISRAEDAISSVELRINTYTQNLAEVLNIDDLSVISINTEAELNSGIDDTDAQVIESALSNNFALQMMEKELNAASKLVSLARQQYIPDFEIGAEYMRDRAMGDSWSVGISMNIPVWTGRISSEIEKAEQMKNSVKKNLEQMVNSVRTETVRNINEYRDAMRKVKLYEDVIVPQASQVVELTQTDYQTGAASIMELIDSQRTLLELEEDLINEFLRAKKAQAQLYNLTGVNK